MSRDALYCRFCHRPDWTRTPGLLEVLRWARDRPEFTSTDVQAAFQLRPSNANNRCTKLEALGVARLLRKEVMPAGGVRKVWGTDGYDPDRPDDRLPAPAYGRIAHPPTVDGFTAALLAVGKALKRRGLEVMVGTGADQANAAMNALADAVGRLEKAATPIRKRKRSG